MYFWYNVRFYFYLFSMKNNESKIHSNKINRIQYSSLKSLQESKEHCLPFYLFIFPFWILPDEAWDSTENIKK